MATSAAEVDESHGTHVLLLHSVFFSLIYSAIGQPKQTTSLCDPLASLCKILQYVEQAPGRVSTSSLCCGIESPGNCSSFTAPNYALKPSTQADVLSYRWDLTMGRENTGSLKAHHTVSHGWIVRQQQAHLYCTVCVAVFFLYLQITFLNPIDYFLTLYLYTVHNKFQAASIGTEV